MAASETVAQIVRQLLDEGIRGAPDGPTWFTDGAGLLASVDGLTAAQASTAPIEGSATVAAHLGHVHWFLSLLNAFARGERPDVDWSRSWPVRTVDEAEWRELRAGLERAFTEFDGHLAAGGADDEAHLMPVLATVAHTAYHLGALRQMVRSLP